jgi:hypothetical protein
MNHFNALAVAVSAAVLTSATHAAEPKVPVNLPAHKEGAYVHQAPTLEDLTPIKASIPNCGK